MIDGGQITLSVLLGDPGPDLAVVRQLGRKIPSFMKDAQDLNCLVPVSGLRVHAVEKGVGMDGDGAKFAG